MTKLHSLQIHDRDSLAPTRVVLQRVQCANHDIVEDAEAARAGVLQQALEPGVMARGAHNTESVAILGIEDTVDGMADGTCAESIESINRM
jgi:hypothetical protein